LRRRKFSRKALAKRFSRSARSVPCFAPGREGSPIPGMQAGTLVHVKEKLFLDRDLHMRREDHSDRLLCGVFGGLVRVLVAPRLHTRPVAIVVRCNQPGNMARSGVVV
jgi:hypothetical protein